MKLNADSGGFLVGSEQVDLSGEQDKLQILRAIKADTAAMRSALSQSTRRAAQAVTPATLTQVVRTAVRRRDAANASLAAPSPASSLKRSRERQTLGGVTLAAAPVAPVPVVRELVTPGAAVPSVQNSAQNAPPVSRRRNDSSIPVATPKRAANGRFLSAAERNGEAGGNDAGEVRERGRMGAVMGKLGDAASKLREGVAGMFAGTEQVDPAIAAAKEVGEITAPLMAPIKGVGSLLFKPRDEQVAREKSEKKVKVPWYRRLWKELRELNEQRGGGGAASSTVKLGGIGGMLMKLPGVGMLGKLLGSVGGALKPLLSLAGKAVLPLAAMFSAVTSFSTSTEEYAARMGIELNGSLAQELGVRFVGVLGDLGNTLTFGLAGKFGEYIAPAVSDMVSGMVDRWNKTTSWIETKWSDMTGKFDTLIDGISKWFADKFGGAVDKVKKAGAVVSAQVEGAAQAVTTKVGDAKAAATTWAADKADGVASLFGGGSAGRKSALRAEMTRSGIADPREQAMFMAQMDHESGGFRASEENLNYSAEGLMKTFPKYYKSLADAQKDARNPEAIANKVYGGRMGNTKAGDGYKFRGRGAIQLTGKDNYAAASKDLGIDLLGNPDLAADPAVAAKVATWYWKKNKLGDAARRGDVTAVTKKINGGTNGLADRKSKYQAYLAAANTGKVSIGPQGVVSKSVSPAPSMVAQANVPTAPRMASAAPPADRQGVPPVPSVPRKVASNESKALPPVVIEQPLSQNIADRGLAQAATGGLGMNLGGR